MTRHVKKFSHGDYWRYSIIAASLFVAGYLLIGQGSSRTSVNAPEAKFADSSPSNLAIIPASGCSVGCDVYGYGQGIYYGYGESIYYGYGQVTYYGYGQSIYDPGYSESTYYGQASYDAGQSSYSPGQSSYSPVQSSYLPTNGVCWDGSAPGPGNTCPPCPVGYLHVGNACQPPAGPTFTGFRTTQGFDASGHLEVRPSLVRSGDTTRVYWGVSNVRDCTVRGTNGDGATGSATGVWNSLGSGPSGMVTSAISSRTDYTLFCHSLVGATPSTITETRTVNVIPRWFEPAGQ